MRMHPSELERYSFYWSEARLIIAAIALFLGGIPPVTLILPSIPLTGVGLILAWIVSGVVSAYLAYRWIQNDQMLFGHKNNLDLAAFWVNIVSGFNLGIAGLLGVNIGMTISSNKILFIVVGVIYLLAAYQLYTRWQAHGQKIF